MSVPVFIFKILGAITTMYYLFVIVCVIHTFFEFPKMELERGLKLHAPSSTWMVMR